MHAMYVHQTPAMFLVPLRDTHREEEVTALKEKGKE